MVDPWKAVGVVVPCGVVQSSGLQVRSSRQSVRMMTTTVTIAGDGGFSHDDGHRLGLGSVWSWMDHIRAGSNRT
jgi:hypothetical protein